MLCWLCEPGSLKDSPTLLGSGVPGSQRPLPEGCGGHRAQVILVVVDRLQVPEAKTVTVPPWRSGAARSQLRPRQENFSGLSL